MGTEKKIYCLTPVYNDWASCTILLERIAQLGREHAGTYSFSVVIVNDGSALSADDDAFAQDNVKVLNLKMNVGHQRAIAIGIQYLHNTYRDADYVVILDSDGEDRPEDIPLLLERSASSRKIIFAKRKKRQDSVLFKIGYFFYKRLFRLLTGQHISFGNFSVIPGRLLKKVALQPNIWNHYSGAIVQSKIPYDTVELDKGKRYEGQSKMNFTSLILHGLSSIAIYFDQLSVRLLIFSLYGIGACVLAVLYILYEKLFTDRSIAGWASSLILIISGIIIQLFSVTLVVLLLQLSSRKNITAPRADIYKDFIDEDENN